jgi:gliding motility-associated-like protein
MQTNRTGIFTTPKLSSDKTFYVRLTNGSCTSEIAAVNVKIVDKQAVYVPTAFSPNNDGKNDIIRPIVLGTVKKFQFTIYNRWGQLIFRVSEIGKGWDGKMAGVLQDPNVFIWTCIYQFEDGEQRMERGTFTLLR